VDSPKHRGRAALLSPRHNRKRPRLSAAVACFALLLQALLPLAFPGSANGRDLRDGSADLPIWSMGSLCAASHATDGTDKTPVPAEKSPGLDRSCPICLGLHLAEFYLPPTTTAIHVPRDHALVPRLQDAAIERLSDWRAASRARAPPDLA
jgi:hypothetical protein